ncbi:MAG: hypothetical protein A2381_17665 [Bdellovibrionales bacterium RIFOXYB1_FULL_37_110]|nr:MAG: hypothetical protein A2181_00790 [Bdellovibrionales bacterium RIFOXYA1_FULL_38_20]OFZ48018.1 MAG: hypothetical protein A2417_15640 [Bdellovibrionales bacterium RIFOXYC1_FULL_37_79]OFZ58035.1 MAG: hypothetical protein A2381_17665 [Bdellovibrionales bacterium RIFOXYB1_FULL_37_110]OFZ61671.1 MAG: hypothetical protein A2577_18120 [Bdellovibrionales bacterium RIFOXYD1_FULL_36_51]
MQVRSFIVILSCFSFISYSAEKADVVDDSIYTLKLMLASSYQQFATRENVYYGVAAVPSLWHSFDHDARYTALFKQKKIRKHEELISDMGIVLTFPVIPIVSYSLSRQLDDNKLFNFALEYTSSVYLTLAESALISFVQIHERPDQSDLSPWETKFRGDSSFPSGHVVPYATLLFKTFQFYGPWTLLPTGTMFYFASKERIKSGKHTMSDVVGSFFLAAFASEGVRKANHYKDNHPFYKWIWQHDVAVGVTYYHSVIGPRLTWYF